MSLDKRTQDNEIKSCSLEAWIQLEAHTIEIITWYLHHPHSSPFIFTKPLRIMSHVHSKKARFRAAQDTRKNLERAVKMEEYQERRTLGKWTKSHEQ